MQTAPSAQSFRLALAQSNPAPTGETHLSDAAERRVMECAAYAQDVAQSCALAQRYCARSRHVAITDRGSHNSLAHSHRRHCQMENDQNKTL
jgi:hypothetical protein